jgi:hypothetical protein
MGGKTFEIQSFDRHHRRGGDDFRPAQGVVYTQTAKGWVLKLAPERQFTTKGERGKECGH